MALTDIQIKAFKPAASAYKRSDGRGLHLLLSPSGGKLWRLAYRFDGKQKTLALGAYPAVSLALARQRRDEAKTLLAEGVDPSAHAKAAKRALMAIRQDTFKAIAAEYVVKVEKEGRAKATMKKIRWMIDLANADLGNRPITEITAGDVLIPLRKVEAAGNLEAARRLRSPIGQVMRFAIASARATHDPTQGLRQGFVRAGGTPEHEAIFEKFSSEMEDLLREALSWEVMEKEMVDLYVESFSEDEIQALDAEDERRLITVLLINEVHRSVEGILTAGLHGLEDDAGLCQRVLQRGDVGLHLVRLLGIDGGDARQHVGEGEVDREVRAADA